MAKVIEQHNLSRKALLSKIEEITGKEQFAEQAQRIQRAVHSFDGLEKATETVLEVAGGLEISVSA